MGSVYETLRNGVAEIKRLGAILCGDEVGDGEPWPRVALRLADSMSRYASVLRVVATGKLPAAAGPVVFPAWDEGDEAAEGSGVATAVAAHEILHRYQEVKTALATAIQVLKDNDLDESMAGEFDVLTDALEGKRNLPPAWSVARDLVRSELVPSPVEPESIKGVPEWGGIPPEPVECCLCHGKIEAVGGWLSGHNAEPVATGRCCDQCNTNVVIPARLREFMHRTAPRS